MTSTSTQSATFTIANARYVSSKIKTDLKLLQRRYGDPSDERIEAFGEEAAQLLNQGYLDTVAFGYRRNGNWTLALRYTANANGTLTSDDRAGGVARDVDVAGASFHSYLTHSVAWVLLDADAREKVEKSLPVSRIGAPAPGTTGGYWTADRDYSSNGTGVARGTFKTI